MWQNLLIPDVTFISWSRDKSFFNFRNSSFITYRIKHGDTLAWAQSERIIKRNFFLIHCLDISFYWKKKFFFVQRFCTVQVVNANFYIISYIFLFSSTVAFWWVTLIKSVNSLWNWRTPLWFCNQLHQICWFFCFFPIQQLLHFISLEKLRRWRNHTMAKLAWSVLSKAKSLVKGSFSWGENFPSISANDTPFLQSGFMVSGNQCSAVEWEDNPQLTVNARSDKISRVQNTPVPV